MLLPKCHPRIFHSFNCHFQTNNICFQFKNHNLQIFFLQSYHQIPNCLPLINTINKITNTTGNKILLRFHHPLIKPYHPSRFLHRCNNFLVSLGLVLYKLLILLYIDSVKIFIFLFLVYCNIFFLLHTSEQYLL